MKITWTAGEWYRCTVTDFEYVESPIKKTKAFEMTCRHPDHGSVVGQWWLTDNTNSKGIPNWQAAFNRLIKLGATEDGLRGQGWIRHAREAVIGKEVACMVEIEEFETQNGPGKKAVAKFIGIPKNDGASQSGYKAADTSVSPFASRAVESAPFGGAADDDVPF